MRNGTTVRAGIAALAGLLLASAAQAATICVNPAGGACQTTIQAAVNMANPGDKIAIGPGVYFENVVVPAGKDGLIIQGASKTSVIVDPDTYTPGGIANTGDGFVVQSRNVQLRNMTIRNGQQSGIVILASGAIVQGNNFVGQDVAGVIVNSPVAFGAQIAVNEFHGSYIGVASQGFGTIIRNNTITGSYYGTYVGGAGGNGAQIFSNKIYNGALGVFVDPGNGALVRANDIRNMLAGAILVVGNNSNIQRNRIFGVLQASALVADCSTGCTGGTVAYNIVTDVPLGYGIEALSDAPGLIVNNNALLRTGLGLSAQGDGIFVLSNKATDVGIVPSGHCFEGFGDFNTFSRNVGLRCSGSGVYVNGNANYLERNVATSTFYDGFTVDGDDGGGGFYQDTTLYLNKTLGDAAQGVAVINGAINTFLYANTASKNRVDYCNDGTGTLTYANIFGTTADTGGTDCPIVR